MLPEDPTLMRFADARTALDQACDSCDRRKVESAMVEFGEALKQWETTAKKPQAIENLSYRLAHCMRQSLSETWSPVFGYVKDAACPWGVSR